MRVFVANRDFQYFHNAFEAIINKIKQNILRKAATNIVSKNQ